MKLYLCISYICRYLLVYFICGNPVLFPIQCVFIDAVYKHDNKRYHTHISNMSEMSEIYGPDTFLIKVIPIGYGRLNNTYTCHFRLKFLVIALILFFKYLLLISVYTLTH